MSDPWSRTATAITPSMRPTARRWPFWRVKTRRSRAFGAPEDAVDARKRARLIRGAAAWLREHPARGARVRFDVMVCEPDPPRGWSVRHIEAAFDASG